MEGSGIRQGFARVLRYNHGLDGKDVRMGNEHINAAINNWVRGEGSPAYLAGMLGVSPQELGLLMSGLHEWKWEQVRIVARVTGSSPNRLAGIE